MRDLNVTPKRLELYLKWNKQDQKYHTQRIEESNKEIEELKKEEMIINEMLKDC